MFGRILAGWMADSVGRYNTQIIMCFGTALSVLCFWLPATLYRSTALSVVFVALFGSVAGAFVSLIPAIIAQISDIRELGYRVGIEFGILGLATLMCNPIGGFLVQANNGSYAILIIWSGALLAAGTLGFIVARTTLVGYTLLSKVQRHVLHKSIQKARNQSLL